MADHPTDRTMTSEYISFDKYERYGAYHWREMGWLPTRYNAILAARYGMVEKMVASDTARLLEVGCGDACLADLLATPSRLVVGVDHIFLPLILGRSRTRQSNTPGRVALSQGDVYRLPFQDASFDCVTLADVIEHLERPDDALVEIARTLRPGGQCVVTTPRSDPSRPLGSYHCHEFTNGELEATLQRVFHRVTVYPFQPIQTNRLYERRLLGRKFARIIMNVFAIAGWNPLVNSGAAENAEAYTHLGATAWKGAR